MHKPLKVLQIQHAGPLLPFALLSVVMAACGPSPSPTTPSAQPSIQSVTVSANVASLTSAGQTAQATATASLSNGTTQDVTATCSNWQSDNTRVLTVNGTGLVTAQASGSATVTTICQAVAGRGTMTVAFKQVGPSTVTLSGTVTDGYSHGILPNIAVQITDGPNAGTATKTDATGHYVLANLVPGAFTVSLSAIRYITTAQAVTLTADSRLDVVLRRNDAFPADGTYSYTLVIRSPVWCLTHAYVSSAVCSYGPGDWVNSDFSWDGRLVVERDGASLRFVLPADPYGSRWGNYSTFVFERTGTQLKGTVVASAQISMSTISTRDYLVSAFMQSDVFSGETDNAGRFWGAFDGQMLLWRDGIPC